MPKSLPILIVMAALAAACVPLGLPEPTATAPAPTAAPSPLPATPTQPPPTVAPTVTPIRVDLSPAQRASMQSLASELGVSMDGLTLVSTEAVDWPDGCLGVVRLGVLCTQAIVPGFRIVLAAGDKQYEYHTNADGSLVVKVETAVRVAVTDANGALSVTEINVPGGPAFSTTSGFLPRGGSAGGVVYAYVNNPETRAVRLDNAGQQQLDFIQHLNYGLGVWPGAGDQPARLGWSTSPTGDVNVSQIYVAAADGSGLTLLREQAVDAQHMSQLVFEGWSSDGQSIYFSEEPVGIGGYILFGGASSLYRLNLADQSVQDLIPFTQSGHFLCLDDFSADERLVANHCDGQTVAVQDLSTGAVSNIQPPAEAAGFGVYGGARFSPDTTRVAFALARGDPGNEQGWVAVSDSLSGASHLVATSQPGQYFSVAAWLNANTLLLQSNVLQCNPTCGSELWLLDVNSGALTKAADGAFVTFVR